MRFFLYTYKGENNLIISKERGLIGTTGSNKAEVTKFKQLNEGDIVIIRDSSKKGKLNLALYGEIIGKPYYEKSRKNVLWKEEMEKGEVLFPYRVKVNFSPDFEMGISKISWEDLEKLPLTNRQGKKMDRFGLGRFFGGNFVTGEEAKRLAKLLCYRLFEDRKIEIEEKKNFWTRIKGLLFKKSH